MFATFLVVNLYAVIGIVYSAIITTALYKDEEVMNGALPLPFVRNERLRSVVVFIVMISTTIAWPYWIYITIRLAIIKRQQKK